MNTTVRIALCALAVAASSADGGAQTTQPSAPAAVLPHVIVSPDALAGLPRRTLTVTGENGATIAYSGVDLGALLAKNGAPHGPTLRGPAAADYALVIATDGYRAVFSLAELDPAVTDKVTIVAEARDGKPLDGKTGPYQIIVPDEKHHVRWVRNVREIDVAAAP